LNVFQLIQIYLATDNEHRISEAAKFEAFEWTLQQSMALGSTDDIFQSDAIMSKIIAKLFSARQSVQETIQTFKVESVTAPVEIEVKTEIENDDLSHPQNEQKNVNSAPIDSPEKMSNNDVKLEVNIEQLVLADKNGTKRIARKRQRSDDTDDGAAMALIGKKQKQISQATTGKEDYDPEAAGLDQQKRAISAEQIETWNKWAAHITAITGEKCSNKQVNFLLNKLNDETHKAAMMTPFESMPKSVMNEVVSTYLKCFGLKNFVPVGFEAADESADEIELFFIKHNQFKDGVAGNGRKKMLSQGQINRYRCRNKEIVAEIMKIFNEKAVNDDEENWADYGLWKERTRVIMKKTGRHYKWYNLSRLITKANEEEQRKKRKLKARQQRKREKTLIEEVNVSPKVIVESSKKLAREETAKIWQMMAPNVADKVVALCDAIGKGKWGAKRQEIERQFGVCFPHSQYLYLVLSQHRKYKASNSTGVHTFP